MYSAHYTVCSAHYTMQCTLYSAQCTLYSVQCTLYTIQCTVHTIQCTVHTPIFRLCPTLLLQPGITDWGQGPRGRIRDRLGNRNTETQVYSIIQFLKVMYLILTLQVSLTLPSVFSETDSVFLKEDTQKCVLTNTCPRACISQYTPMGVASTPPWECTGWYKPLGVYCAIHTPEHLLREWTEQNRTGLGSVSHSQTSPDKGFCQDAFG